MADFFTIAINIFFDPENGFRMVKQSRNKNAFIAGSVAALFLLMIAVRLVAIFFTHYPLRSVEPENTNISMEIANLVIPLILWVVSSYMVTTIMDGESTLAENLAATSFAMLPYIVFTVPLTVLSLITTSGDILFYNVFANPLGGAPPVTIYGILSGIIMLWSGILIFYSLYALNSYGFWEAVKIAIISLLGCLFICVALVLIYVLGEKVFGFIEDIIYEYTLLFRDF